MRNITYIYTGEKRRHRRKRKDSSSSEEEEEEEREDRRRRSRSPIYRRDDKTRRHKKYVRDNEVHAVCECAAIILGRKRNQTNTREGNIATK